MKFELTKRELELLHSSLEGGKKEVLEKMLPQWFPKQTFKIGDKFYREKQNDPYILASVGANEVALIGTEHGNRFNNPIKVNNTKSITVKEAREIGIFAERMIKV